MLFSSPHFIFSLQLS